MLPFPLDLLLLPLALIPPALVLYALLVWLGRRRLARRNAAPILASIDELGRRQLQLNAFGKKHEDGRSHPYPVMRAPAPSADRLGTGWQLSDKRDHSNAAMVGLTTDIPADKDPDIFICLPLNGHPGGFVRVRAEVDAHRATWEPLAAELAPQLAPFAQPIIELQQLSAPYEREQQIQQSPLTRLASLDKLEANWHDVAIPETTLEQVIKLVDRFAAGQPPLPKGMLLWGPPGTGKTRIARKLAQHVDCNFVAVTIADLKGEHIGHTVPKVKKLWEQARGQGPTILFVDECESAFARRGSRDTDNFGNELVQTFIAEWDGFNQGGGNVLVIGATNRRELIDDAVLSRFTVSIELPAPDAGARERILSAEFGKAQLALPVTEALVRETSGMSGRDLSTLVTSVVATHPAGRPSLEDFSAAIARLRGKNSTSVQALGWDDVILPASTRAEFESLGKELLHAEELARMNIPVPRGILLYGPPGTGKTQIARVLASQSGLSFIAASSTDVKGQFIGDGGARVKQLFEKARAGAVHRVPRRDRHHRPAARQRQFGQTQRRDRRSAAAGAGRHQYPPGAGLPAGRQQSPRRRRPRRHPAPAAGRQAAGFRGRGRAGRTGRRHRRQVRPRPAVAGHCRHPPRPAAGDGAGWRPDPGQAAAAGSARRSRQRDAGLKRHGPVRRRTGPSSCIHTPASPMREAQHVARCATCHERMHDQVVPAQGTVQTLRDRKHRRRAGRSCQAAAHAVGRA